LGYKHTDEAKNIISLSNKTRKVSDETKAKLRIAGLAKKHSNPNSQKIIVTDLKTNITTSYESIGLAAKALGIKPTRISMYFINNQIKPYKGRYIKKKIIQKKIFFFIYLKLVF
jgi:NUMOD1 domain/NUMOD3 motif